MQFAVNALRVRFQAKVTALEDRKAFVYLLARFVKSFHFLSCFFTYSDEVKEFVTFADYVGPQLIKQDSVSELMKQIRQNQGCDHRHGLHRSLAQDCPEPRVVEPPDQGKIIELPLLGGLQAHPAQLR